MFERIKDCFVQVYPRLLAPSSPAHRDTKKVMNKVADLKGDSYKVRLFSNSYCIVS